MSRSIPVAALAAIACIACGGDTRPGRADGAAAPADTLAVVYESESLSVVRAIAVDERTGRVAGVNAFAPFVHVLDSTGAPLAAVGRQGRGPQEIFYPAGAHYDPTGDTLWVTDVGNRRLIALTGDRELGVTRPLPPKRGFVLASFPEVSYGEIGRAARLGDRLLLDDVAGQVAAAGELRRLVLVAHRLDGAGADTVADFSVDSLYAGGGPGLRGLFAEVPLWSGCGARAERAAILDPARDQVRWIDAGLRTVATVAVPTARRPLADDDLRRHMRHRVSVDAREENQQIPDAELEALLDRTLPELREGLPTEAPRWVRLLCDSDGTVLLQGFDTADDPRGYGREVLVVRPDGATSRLTLPPRFEPMAAARGALWGVVRDELDVPAVARLALGNRAQ